MFRRLLSVDAFQVLWWPGLGPPGHATHNLLIETGITGEADRVTET